MIGSGGAPNLGFSVDPDDTPFNPLKLVSGTWPRGSDQVAIDSGTASEALRRRRHDRRRGQGPGPGLPDRRDREAPAASRSAERRSPSSTCRRRRGSSQSIGQLDVIRVQAKTGVSTASCSRRSQPVLPPTAQARDASAQVKEDKKTVSGFTTFIQIFLLAFAGIALFVGAFVIANTLGITIAQRTREFATLRTIGASRRQVLQSVDRRGARHRHRSARSSGCSSGSGSRRCSTRSSSRSGSTCRQRERSSRRERSSSASCSAR